MAQLLKPNITKMTAKKFSVLLLLLFSLLNSSHSFASTTSAEARVYSSLQSPHALTIEIDAPAAQILFRSLETPIRSMAEDQIQFNQKESANITCTEKKERGLSPSYFCIMHSDGAGNLSAGPAPESTNHENTGPSIEKTLSGVGEVHIDSKKHEITLEFKGRAAGILYSNLTSPVSNQAPIKKKKTNDLAFASFEHKGGKSLDCSETTYALSVTSTQCVARIKTNTQLEAKLANH